MDSYEALDEQSYERNSGQAIIASSLLDDFLAKGQTEKVLAIVRASLHINEPALMRAHDINLAEKVLKIYEANAGNEAIERNAIYCLHSLLCHKFLGTPSSPAADYSLYALLREQFREADGIDALTKGPRAETDRDGTPLDAQTSYRILDIILSCGTEDDARAIYPSLAPLIQSKEYERICVDHPDSFVCKDRRRRPPPPVEAINE